MCVIRGQSNFKGFELNLVFATLFLMLISCMASGASATGGTITTILVNEINYTVHTFTSSGTFNVTGSMNATVLVVAGGGGGGGNGPGDGGGGAGGLIYNSSYPANTSLITVTVGSGGIRNGQGGNSVFGVLTAIGGGRGGEYQANLASVGGSGGGGSGRGSSHAGAAGTAGQGNAGGYGYVGTNDGGGGGGGAGAVGAAGVSNTRGGAGGNGLNYSINGSNVYYAGGGGGGTDVSGAGGAGGLGGGGNGYNHPSGLTSGTPNTGGGGGAGSGGNNSGGSGIVIVRYLTNMGNLSVNFTIGGTAIGNNSSFTPPANLTIAATASAGYYFVNWTTNCNGTIFNTSNAQNPVQTAYYSNSTSLSNSFSITAVGGFAYVASYGGNSITTFNISGANAQNPVQTAYYTNATSLNGTYSIITSGGYAYVISNNGNSITTFNISGANAPNPVQTAYYTNVTSLYFASSIVTSGNYAYVVSSNSNSITTFNISGANAQNPVQTAYYANATSLYYASSIATSGSYVYVVSMNSKSITTFNISGANAQNPVQIAFYNNSTSLPSPSSISTYGGYAYVASSGGNSITTFNISGANAPKPVQTAFYNNSTSLNSTTSITASDGYAYVVSYNGNSITAVNISGANAPNPVQTAYYKNSTSLNSPTSITTSGGYAYVLSANGRSITTFDISTTTKIQVNDATACYAQANFKQYGNMTVNSTASGIATGNNSSFIPPVNLAIAATPNAGYYFANWTVTTGNCTVNNTTNANTQVQVNNDSLCNVQANFGSLPVMNSSVILPSPAYTNSSLQGFCNGTTQDGTNLSYNYTWYRNGMANTTGTSGIIGGNPSITAVGGTKTTIIDNGISYTVHTFTSNGIFNISTPANVSVLVVAGGGGGGGNQRGEGGGGAGGLIYNSSYFVAASLITVSVGSGGGRNAQGENSVFNTLTAIGGGRGGEYRANLASVGGSGGGGSGVGSSHAGAAGTAGQGNAGGYGYVGTADGGGGGGGAGAVGADGVSNTRGGAGGNGLNYSINGSNVYYAGGGGGGTDKLGAGGAGGLGGGGNGYNYPSGQTNGTPNTGGGAGSGGNNSGGSGIVIVRYPTPSSGYQSGQSVNVGNISNSSLSAGQNWTLQCTAFNPNGASSPMNSTVATVLAVLQTAGNLTVNSSAGGLATGNNSTFVPPANLTINATNTSSRYYFDTWSVTAGNCTVNNTTNSNTKIQVFNISVCNVQANFGLYGNLTVNATTGGSSTGNNTNFIPPANLSINATNTSSRYYFANWSVTTGNCTVNNTTNANTQVQVNNSSLCNVQANFGLYGNLTVNATAGGSVLGNNSTFVLPANLTINATPTAGYIFMNWTKTTGNCNISNSSNPNTKVQVNNSSLCNVQANFAPSFGNLTVNSGAGGSATGNNSTFVPPTNQTITATPNFGYHFDNWTVTSGNCSVSDSSNPSTTVQVFNTSTCTVLASFGSSMGILIVNFASGGTATGNNSTLVPPVNQTINATPSAGYYFVNWTVVTGNCSVLNPANPNTKVQVLNTTQCAVLASFAPDLPFSISGISGGQFMVIKNGVSYTLNSSVPVNDNAWHHVVATYDNSTMKLYVDGVLQNSASYGFGSLPTNSFPVQLGKPYDSANPNGYFNGMMDEVAIYNRSLNASEISQMYDYSKNGLGTYFTAPISAVTFSGASSTNLSLVADLSNVTNLTLEVPNKGKIQFPPTHSVNAVAQNYDAHVKIDKGFVSVNTSALDTSFNSQATLVMDLTGVYSGTSVPAIYYYSGFADTSAAIIQSGTICSAPRCTDVVWNPATQILTFNVSGFSGYAIYGGNYGYDAELGITITSTNQIAIYTSNGLNDTVFDFKPVTPPAGDSVTLMSNETSNTTTGETGFLIQNQGNVNVSINVSSDKNVSSFIGGTASLFQLFGKENETGACAGINTSMQDLADSGKILCPSLRFTDSSDTIWGYILIKIDSDSPPRTNKAILTFTSTEVQ